MNTEKNIIGIDTHKDTHTAAILNHKGQLLDVASFEANQSGYKRLLDWAQSHGDIECFSIEGTSSYGASLTRFLKNAAHQVLEAARPSRQLRRRHGKSAPADAEAAARTALAGQTLGKPKSQDGPVESIRMLRSQRRSAIKARTQAANQLHATLVSAPDRLRRRFGSRTMHSIVSLAVKFRVSNVGQSIEHSCRYVLRGLAKRWLSLNAEVKVLDKCIADLVKQVAPDFTKPCGIGNEVASALLVAAGDNPERLKNEASFAALCGVCPVDASSGRQRRHRLNRGGKRDANRALWVIAFVRMRHDERTKRYVDKRTGEGLSRMEILRCLKRYIAREIFALLRPLQAPVDT